MDDQVDERSEWQRRIGVGERQHRFGVHAGTNKVTPVVADEGPARGRVVGKQTEHWSGRVDAVARPQTFAAPKPS